MKANPGFLPEVAIDRRVRVRHDRIIAAVAQHQQRGREKALAS